MLDVNEARKLWMEAFEKKNPKLVEIMDEEIKRILAFGESPRITLDLPGNLCRYDTYSYLELKGFKITNTYHTEDKSRFNLTIEK